MGAVQALLRATGGAFLRARLFRLRRHLARAAVFAGIALGGVVVTFGFLAAALYNWVEREIGPVNGALAVGILAAVLAVIAALLVRAQLRNAIAAIGLDSRAGPSVPPEAEPCAAPSFTPFGLGKKPDFMQLASVVALGIALGVLNPTQRR